MTEALYPLLAHADADAVVAIRRGPAGETLAVTARQLVTDARRLARALPPGGFVLNVCADRYHFAVGLAAALLSGKVSLLPSTHTPEMVAQMRAFAPDVFCLTDRASAIALPQHHYAGPQAHTGDDDDFEGIPRLPHDQLVAYVFTSGSTGLPLPHAKTWGRLVRNVQAGGQRWCAPGTHIVGTVPPQHMYGFESTLLVAWHTGSIFTADHPFYPADIASALQSVPQPRVLVTTPVHLRALLDAGVPVPALDGVLCATAPLSPQLALQAEKALDAPLVEIYGSTETGQIATRRTVHGPTWELFGGVQLVVEDGRTWARGGHVEQPVAMSDVLECQSDARFLLHGRIADMVNIAGKRSSLGYLNHQLNAIEGVIDGAFYMPREEEGDARVARLMAFVVAPSLTVAQLQVQLRQRIDAAFMPRPIVLLSALPRNSTGKLAQDALKTLAQDALRAAGEPHAV